MLSSWVTIIHLSVRKILQCLLHEPGPFKPERSSVSSDCRVSNKLEFDMETKQNTWKEHGQPSRAWIWSSGQLQVQSKYKERAMNCQPATHSMVPRISSKTLDSPGNSKVAIPRWPFWREGEFQVAIKDKIHGRKCGLIFRIPKNPSKMP